MDTNTISRGNLGAQYTMCENTTHLLRQVLVVASVRISSALRGIRLVRYSPIVPPVFIGVSHTMVCVGIVGVTFAYALFSRHGRYLEIPWYHRYRRYDKKNTLVSR